MTVCITGDVHHMSLGTRDQEYLDGRTEVDCALEYARIASEYDVPVTLFITGKAAVEEPEKVRQLSRMDNVEIGGHNHYAFGTLAHKAFRGLTGSWNGPRPFQSWEIQKAVKTFEELGIEITSWRDHAYRHDGNTVELLLEQDIMHFSDAVEPQGNVRREDGIIIVPINTPPDHEHVYHAFRTPEFVTGDGFKGPFGTESTGVDKWRTKVIEYISDHLDKGHVATVLAHPTCMQLADGFHAFEELCATIPEDHKFTSVHHLDDTR